MGDDDSVRGLYERFAPQVYRRARRLLGRDADAWDAVQEVFEKVLSARSKFRGDAQPMTFLVPGDHQRQLEPAAVAGVA